MTYKTLLSTNGGGWKGRTQQARKSSGLGVGLSKVALHPEADSCTGAEAVDTCRSTDAKLVDAEDTRRSTCIGAVAVDTRRSTCIAVAVPMSSHFIALSLVGIVLAGDHSNFAAHGSTELEQLL